MTDADIFNFLKSQRLSDAGAAGLMGNLYAESGLRSNNLQNSYERTLGYSDSEYTLQVDSGLYTNFANDHAGYGLAQWTYSTRKASLLAYAKATKKSIGDMEMQLNFLMKELKESFPKVLSTLKTASSVREASDIVLLQFERPANQSEANCAKRASYGQVYFDKYAKRGEPTMSNYTNSPLATVTMISPNKNSPRNHVIDTITIHCFVGQVTAKRGCEVFQPTSKKASCNYVVGKDGDIGLCVEERDRSWCSSNGTNDNRAVTIETACDSTEPYAVNPKAYAALIDLVTDICRRNGIKKLIWSTNKNDRVNHLNGCNMTVHRDYANKSCPGTYLYERHGEIAAEVNKRLGSATPTPIPTPTPTPTPGKETMYRVRKSWADASSQLGAFKNFDNAKRLVDQHPGYSAFDETGKQVYPAPEFEPYKVRIDSSVLRIRTGPGTDYSATGKFTGKGVFTIVEESSGKGSAAGWGKLKSGAGWVALDYCKKL